MDTAVEAVFVPSPVVRAVPDVQYCGGGPARTPHVVAQANAEAGGVVVLRVPERPGHYRVFVRGGGSVLVDVLPEAPDAIEVRPGEPDAGACRVAVGGVVRVHNTTSRAAHVKLESLDRRDDAATALDLATLGSFRRRFGRQTLRAGLSLQVGRVALLFSDLAESTRLYAELGDAEAFRVVHDHFDVVSEAVARHGGTIVKTIGDAVMAAFPDERGAIRAGVDILHAFRGFRASDPRRARTDIKIGVHAGPCYAVTANHLLDYFGQTVNLAARLQGLAGSGELVVLEALADELRSSGVEVGEPVEVALKGVSERVRVVRARVAVATEEGGT
jgi:class 3 adenylate cyclase